MQLTIHRIILWPKNQGLKPRVISFGAEKLNVITGQSGTGKSTLISIVDYALGSGKCAIPVGLIRQTTEWFGVILKLSKSYVTIARRNPGDAVQSGDAMLIESDRDEVPSDAKHTLNIREVVSYFDRVAGLPDIDFKGGVGSSNFDARPSFRDMAAFNFQPQHIVANPYTLFFKADTEEHRRKLANVLPFVLGATSAEQLIARRRLADLEREVKFARDEYNVRQSTITRVFEEVATQFTRAKELGILDQAIVAQKNWQTIDYVNALETGLRMAREGRLPIPQVGGTDSSVRELVRLTLQEEGVSRDLARNRSKLARLETLSRTATSYGSDLAEKSRRLEGLGWFKKKVLGKNACPFCGSENESVQREIAALQIVADEASRVSAKLEGAPTVLNRETEDTRAGIRQLEESLGTIRRQIRTLEDESQRVAERRQVLTEVYRFLGTVEQFLLSYRSADKGADLVQKLARLEADQSALRKQLDPRGQKEREEDALKQISNLMGHYTTLLELERATDRASLNVGNLAVRIGAAGDREDYLWEIGSGENWVGYHLAALLSLHEFFLTRSDSPVATFLMIDQPSQVYFPERWPGDPAKDASTSPVQRALRVEDNDIAGVRRIFRALTSAVERTNGRLQVIVTDHAGAITWQGLDVNVVAEWRTGRGDFLIPEAWQKA